MAAFLSAFASSAEFQTLVGKLPSSLPLVLGVFSVLAGLGFFVLHGRGYLTPFSVVFFGWAVFFGLPTLLLEITGSMTVAEQQASLCAALAFCALALAFPSRSREMVKLEGLEELLLVRRGSVIIAATLVAGLSLLLVMVNPLLNPVGGSGLVACALALFTLGVVDIKRKVRFTGLLTVALSIAVAVVWLLFSFTGPGRINVAAVGLGFLMIWLRWFPSRRVKLVATLVTPVGVTWAGMRRASEAALGDVWIQGLGLGSLMAPVKTFGTILEKRESLALGPAEWSDQVVASLLFWIPRDIWPTKPEGIGRLLVYDLAPDLSSTGHSIAGSWLGEGYAYGGPLGVFTVIFVMAGFAMAIERAFWHGGSGYGLRKLAFLIGSVWASVQLLSYIWGSMFSFASRTGLMMFGLGMLVIIAGLLHKIVVVASPTRRVASRSASLWSNPNQ